MAKFINNPHTLLFKVFLQVCHYLLNFLAHLHEFQLFLYGKDDIKTVIQVNHCKGTCDVDLKLLDQVIYLFIFDKLQQEIRSVNHEMQYPEIK